MPFWAMLDYRYCATPYWLFVWTRTDEPINLVMFYTAQDPLYRISWPERRGIPHEARDPTFPAEWRSIDQNPPYDSTIHIFHLMLDPIPTALWLLFRAHHYLPPYPSQAGPYHVFIPPEATYILIDSDAWTA